MFGQVHHPNLLANGIAKEVDDDVVTLGDTLLVKLSEHDRVREQITVIGDLDHVRTVAQRDLEEARDCAIQNAEAILAPLDFKVRLVSEIYGHPVAEETIEIEDVHRELTLRVPRLVGDHQVHVVIEVTP